MPKTTAIITQKHTQASNTRMLGTSQIKAQMAIATASRLMISLSSDKITAGYEFEDQPVE